MDGVVVVEEGVFYMGGDVAKLFGEVRAGFVGAKAEDAVGGVEGLLGELEEGVGGVVGGGLGVDVNTVLFKNVGCALSADHEAGNGAEVEVLGL